MHRVLAFGLIALIGIMFLVDVGQAQPPPRLWMVHNVLYPNGSPVPEGDLSFEAWLKKVSGGETGEILTEESSGCGNGSTDPQIWVEASGFGEYDQPGTWWAVGDTIYCKIFAANDPQSGETDSTVIWDLFDDLPPGTSYEYYPQTDVTVPIELVSFAADVVGDDVLLTWVVASEIDNLGFYIQRGNSPSGLYARASELIPGRGTTDLMAEYSWTDVRPDGTVLYYRLEDVDFSGRSTVHNPVRVTLGATSSWGQIKAEFSD